jgi:hypothetical protein
MSQAEKLGLEGALVYYERMTNSIRPLLRHTLSSPILVPDYAQQLSPQINVELGGGPEVFGWDRCAGHLCSMLMLGFCKVCHAHDEAQVTEHRAEFLNA